MLKAESTQIYCALLSIRLSGVNYKSWPTSFVYFLGALIRQVRLCNRAKMQTWPIFYTEFAKALYDASPRIHKLCSRVEFIYMGLIR